LDYFTRTDAPCRIPICSAEAVRIRKVLGARRASPSSPSPGAAAPPPGRWMTAPIAWAWRHS